MANTNTERGNTERSTVHLTCRLEQRLSDRLEQTVERDDYRCRSAAVQEAIRRLVLRSEIEERVGDELDIEQLDGGIEA